MHLHKRKGLRLLAALLACCLFFSALSIRPALAAGFFSDVPPTAWYAKDVLDLVDKGMDIYKEAGIKAHGYVCDVTNEEAVQAMEAKV